MIKHFTHTDLDGVSCYIVSAAFFGEENIEVEYCNYDDVNEKILAFLHEANLADYQEIFITDISVSDELSLLIDSIHKEGKTKVTLIDHHKTALWLNQYDWAHVRVTTPTLVAQKSEDGGWAEFIKEIPESGTSLLNAHLLDRDIYPEYINEGMQLDEYVEQVRRYDTWEWHNVYKDSYPKELNDLLKLYGKDQYIKNVITALKEGNDVMSETDFTIIELTQKQINRYIYAKNKSLQLVPYENYQIGVVFAENHLSELGNKLGELNPDADMIMMINLSTNTASLRSIKDEVDVAEFAKSFGGGGHAKAAGMPLLESIKDNVIDVVLS